VFRLTATYSRPAREIQPGDVVDLGRPFTVDEVTSRAAHDGTVLVRALGRFPGERRRRSTSWKADERVAVIAPDGDVDVVWGLLLDLVTEGENASSPFDVLDADPAAITVGTSGGLLRLALEVDMAPEPEPEPYSQPDVVEPF
jgi:hypothetical protein